MSKDGETHYRPAVFGKLPKDATANVRVYCGRSVPPRRVTEVRGKVTCRKCLAELRKFEDRQRRVAQLRDRLLRKIKP